MMSSEYSGCSCGTQVLANAAVALDGTDISSCGVHCFRRPVSMALGPAKWPSLPVGA